MFIVWEPNVEMGRMCGSDLGLDSIPWSVSSLGCFRSLSSIVSFSCCINWCCVPQYHRYLTFQKFSKFDAMSRGYQSQR